MPTINAARDLEPETSRRPGRRCLL